MKERKEENKSVKVKQTGKYWIEKFDGEMKERKEEKI